MLACPLPFVRERRNGVLCSPVYIRAAPFIVHNSHDIDLLSVAEDLLNLNANTIRDKSGLRVYDVERLDLHIAEFKPLSGSGYLPVPEFLFNKKGIVNVVNKDNRSFGYSILASKYAHLEPNRHVSRASFYDRYFEAEHLVTLPYPVEPEQIPVLEELLNLKINVFSFYDDEGRARIPVYVTRREHLSREFNLLY